MADTDADLFDDDISLKAIRDAALAVIVDDLKPYLDEINTNKEAALTSSSITMRHNTARSCGTRRSSSTKFRPELARPS